MKKEIIGYINGVISSYTNTISVLTQNGGFNASINSFVAIKNEFMDLLEVVIDIPEEKTISDFNLALENENLKQNNAELLNRIIELNQVEECNDHIAAINQKLRIENNKLIDENQNLTIACSLLKERTDPKKMNKLELLFKNVK